MQKNKVLFFFIFFLLTAFASAGPYSYYKKGIKFLKKGNTAQAEKQFLSLIKKYPQSSYKIKAELGLIECRTNYFDTLVQLQDFIKSHPAYQEKAELYYKLGSLYYLHNNLDSAEQKFSVITNLYKKSDFYFPALYWLGNIQIQNRQFDKAIVLFQTIINHKRYNSYQPLASLRIADIYFYQKKFYSAITNYKKTLKNYRTSSVKLESYFFLAQSYELTENYQQAQVYYEKVIKKYKHTQFADMSYKKIQYLQKKHPALLRKKTRKQKKQKTNLPKLYYVQVGSFEHQSSANDMRLFLKKLKYPVFFKKVKTKKQYIYKVRIGAYKLRSQAEKIKQELKTVYKLDAFIVQE